MSLLACQRDSYRRSIVADVIAAEELGGAWGVVLADTVLYPEGGGQPDDRGEIDGQPVRALRKDPRGVLHVLDAAPAGPRVTVTLDWARRFDHMQQHTGQHLLSAVALDRLGAATVAFHLLPDVCDVEVDKPLTPDQVRGLEEAVNAEIRAARPVQAREVAAEELAGVRSRGLPPGLTGPVRLVEIVGVDLNTCGGTHVRSTAEIQCVRLLPPQPSKAGCRLRYLAGGRVLSALAAAQEREGALSKLLSTADHAAAVARLQGSAKDSDRALRAIEAELSGLLGESLARQGARHLHRPGADLRLLQGIAAAFTAADPDSCVLLTGEGVFLLAGPPAAVARLGPPIAALLEGRGGGAAGRYQGKAARLDEAPAAAELLGEAPKIGGGAPAPYG